MYNPKEIEYSTSAKHFIKATGVSALRYTLLFGGAAIVFALIVIPFIDQGNQGVTQDSPFGIDTTTTASVRGKPQFGPGKVYTIRRSVLQKYPNSTCYIQKNGQKFGQCN